MSQRPALLTWKRRGPGSQQHNISQFVVLAHGRQSERFLRGTGAADFHWTHANRSISSRPDPCGWLIRIGWPCTANTRSQPGPDIPQLPERDMSKILIAALVALIVTASVPALAQGSGGGGAVPRPAVGGSASGSGTGTSTAPSSEQRWPRYDLWFEPE